MRVIKLLVTAMLSLAIGTCGRDKGTGGGSGQGPRVRILSFSPSSGPPGTAIKAVTSGEALVSGAVAARMAGAILPAMVSDANHFTFFVPIHSSGHQYVVLIDSEGVLSDSLAFNVSAALPTNKPPGEIFREVSQTTDQAVSAFLSLAGKLKGTGLLPAADSVALQADMLRLSRFLDNLNAEVESWPDSEKTAFDSYLMQAGLYDLSGAGSQSRGLKGAVAAIQAASTNPSGAFDEFEALVLADNLSMTLSALKAGLSVSTIAAILVPGGQLAGIALGALSIAVGALDGAIDGFLPTDLRSVQVNFVPNHSGGFAIGDSASVTLTGAFQSQSSPEQATIKVGIETLLFSVKVLIPEEVLKMVGEQLIDKIADMAAVSTTEALITSQPVTQASVAVDLKYYSRDFRSLFVSAGIVQALASLLDKIGVEVPSLGNPPLTVSNPLISYDPTGPRIIALNTGQISPSDFHLKVWANKPVCKGWWSFVCFGIELPKALPSDSIHFPSITIGPALDRTAPAAVTDLASTSPTQNSVTLNWTAPGDDGNTGTATQYDVRYSTSPISSSNWSSAVQATAEPMPLPAGTSQTFDVAGLNANTTYYFALETADEVPNWSALSSVAFATTTVSLDLTPPAPITTLEVTYGYGLLNKVHTGCGGLSLGLEWVSTGDDGMIGTAAQYDIRYSTSPITESNWSSLPQLPSVPVPQLAGTRQFYGPSGLVCQTLYYFAMKASDEASNWSALSNVDSGKFLDIMVDCCPPSPVTTLAAIDSSSTSVTLAWTAPGADDNYGTAAQYDVRYSTSAITESNWNSATQAQNEPSPLPAGSAQIFAVTGLQPTTRYYFALKTADEVPNWSGLSSVVTATTTPQEPSVLYACSGVGFSSGPSRLWAVTIPPAGPADSDFGLLAEQNSTLLPMITDIAWRRGDLLFAVGSDRLYDVNLPTSPTYDPNQAVATLRSRMTIPSGTVAAAFGPDGALYVGTQEGGLYVINAVNETYSFVLQLPQQKGFSGDLVFETSSSLFYATADLGNDLLIQGSTADLSSRIVGPIGIPYVFGLSLVDGQLFGMTSSSSGRGVLLRINRNTGQGEAIRSLTFNAFGGG